MSYKKKYLKKKPDRINKRVYRGIVVDHYRDNFLRGKVILNHKIPRVPILKIYLCVTEVAKFELMIIIIIFPVFLYSHQCLIR